MGTNWSWPVWPTSLRIGRGVADAGHLDDDPVRARGHDHRLRHAGRVHAALDDLLDDLDVADRRDLVPFGIDPVLDLQPALKIKPELRLDPAGSLAAVSAGRVRFGQKSMTSASRPMTAMRIGPVLRTRADDTGAVGPAVPGPGRRSGVEGRL